MLSFSLDGVSSVCFSVGFFSIRGKGNLQDVELQEDAGILIFPYTYFSVACYFPAPMLKYNRKEVGLSKISKYDPNSTCSW